MQKIPFAHQGARTPIMHTHKTANTSLGPVVLLYTVVFVALCNATVVPSCTKLRTTWGKHQHNLRNILISVDQSELLDLAQRAHKQAHKEPWVPWNKEKCVPYHSAGQQTVPTGGRWSPSSCPAPHWPAPGRPWTCTAPPTSPPTTLTCYPYWIIVWKLIPCNFFLTVQQ